MSRIVALFTILLFSCEKSEAPSAVTFGDASALINNNLVDLKSYVFNHNEGENSFSLELHEYVDTDYLLNVTTFVDVPLSKGFYMLTNARQPEDSNRLGVPSLGYEILDGHALGNWLMLNSQDTIADLIEIVEITDRHVRGLFQASYIFQQDTGAQAEQVPPRIRVYRDGEFTATLPTE